MLTSPALKAQASLNAVRWVIEKNSSLRVDSKSNINSFTCNISDYDKSNTITCMVIVAIITFTRLLIPFINLTPAFPPPNE